MFLNLKTAFGAAILSLVFGGFEGFIRPANAGLFLSPMYLKMESHQGQSKGVLQVGNTSPEPIRVSLYLTAFSYNKNGVFQRHNTQDQESVNSVLDHDLTPYVRYSPREMVIPGNSSRRVRLISLLPPSLPEGEYRTAIFAETLQEKTDSQGFKVGFNMSIGAALYVAKGEIKPEITIVAGNLEQPQPQLNLLVSNEGNATAKGKISWTLKQGIKVIASGESGGSFLPQSKTNLVLNHHQEEKLDLASGNYQLSGKIIWEKLDEEQASNFKFDLKF